MPGGVTVLALIVFTAAIVVLLKRCKQKEDRSHDFTDHIYNVPIRSQCKQKSELRETETGSTVNLFLHPVLSPSDMQSNIAYGCNASASGQQRSTDVLLSEVQSSEVSTV